jgi:hypothetical protein
MEGGAVGFLEELDHLIDRPCRRDSCDKVIPESSPSDDFCSERCEAAWRAENNGCKYVDSWLGEGYVQVPEGHPAEPTHQPPSTDLTVSAPGGVGVFQVLSSAWARDYAALADDRNALMGVEGGWVTYRDWAQRLMQRATPEAFGNPLREPRAQIRIGDTEFERREPTTWLRPGQAFILGDHGSDTLGIVTGVTMGFDGEVRTYFGIDPAGAEMAHRMRPPSEDGSQVADAITWANDIVARRQQMQRTIAETFGIPPEMLGVSRLDWMMDEASLLLRPKRTMGQEWIDQCRDDADWIEDKFFDALDFLFFDLPEAVASGVRRAWRFVTRS